MHVSLRFTYMMQSGVKQGCVLAPILFGTFLSLLLPYAFDQTEDGSTIHARSDVSLFNLARLHANTRVRKVLLREILFADSAAFTAHTEEALQRLISALHTHITRSVSQSLSRKQTSGGRYQQSPLHPPLQPRCCRGFNLPWLHHLQQRLPVHRAEHPDRQGSISRARLTKGLWENSMLFNNAF